MPGGGPRGFPLKEWSNRLTMTPEAFMLLLRYAHAARSACPAPILAGRGKSQGACSGYGGGHSDVPTSIGSDLGVDQQLLN